MAGDAGFLYVDVDEGECMLSRDMNMIPVAIVIRFINSKRLFKQDLSVSSVIRNPLIT